MDRWEYAIFLLPERVTTLKQLEPIHKQIDVLGLDGWELAGVRDELFIFKRPSRKEKQFITSQSVEELAQEYDQEAIVYTEAELDELYDDSFAEAMAQQ